jgi:MraZ protein
MFLGTHENKVDKKGRVSVPASFRAAFAGPEGGAIAAFPNFDQPAIEVWTIERMRRLQDGMDDMEQFSQEQRDLANLIFAESRLMNLDGEGRITLAKDLAAHAGVTDLMLFVGQGATFQIWEPSHYRAYMSAVRGRAAQGGVSIRLGPAGRTAGP